MYVKNQGSGDRWLSGTIISVSGPVSYHVELFDGRVWKYHQDQLRGRVIDSSDSDDLIDIPSVEPPPVPDDSPSNPAVVEQPAVESDERVRQRPNYYHDSVRT